MPNAAQADSYKQQLERCAPLFAAENLKNTEEQALTSTHTITIREYAGRVNDRNLCGSECILSQSGQPFAQWQSVSNSAVFYRVIHHSNGREYLIFRQDLYGYSVLDLESGESLRFYPEASLGGKGFRETFIWTDVMYNTVTNVLAVDGCYWACPYSLHLFDFAEPMSESPRYVDMIECFEGGYDVYDDISFVAWDGGDLSVTRYVVESRTKEPVTLAPEEYLAWLAEKGQAL